MPVSAIDNTNLLQICRDCGATGFLPVVAYAYDVDAATVTLVNTSTIPSGDTFVKMKVQLFDKFGNEKRGAQTVQATALVISTSGLNLSAPLDIKVLIITTNKINADGGAYNIQAGGNVENWDVQKN